MGKHQKPKPASRSSKATRATVATLGLGITTLGLQSASSAFAAPTMGQVGVAQQEAPVVEQKEPIVLTYASQSPDFAAQLHDAADKWNGVQSAVVLIPANGGTPDIRVGEGVDMIDNANMSATAYWEGPYKGSILIDPKVRFRADGATSFLTHEMGHMVGLPDAYTSHEVNGKRVLDYNPPRGVMMANPWALESPTAEDGQAVMAASQTGGGLFPGSHPTLSEYRRQNPAAPQWSDPSNTADKPWNQPSEMYVVDDVSDQPTGQPPQQQTEPQPVEATDQ